MRVQLKEKVDKNHITRGLTIRKRTSEKTIKKHLKFKKLTRITLVHYHLSAGFVKHYFF